MNATFHDLQQSGNPRNGIVLSSAKVIADLFKSLIDREPFIFELRGGDGFTLTIGFGGTHGFVQYGGSDGEAPYRVAVTVAETADEPRSFLAGDQPAEVPVRFCLPIGRVEEMAAEFITTGRRPNSVAWEEI